MPTFLKYILIAACLTALGATVSSLVFAFPLHDWKLWFVSTLPAVLLTPVCVTLFQVIHARREGED